MPKPHCRGHLDAVEVAELVTTLKELPKNCSRNGSPVEVLQVKEVIARKKKTQTAKDCLDSDSVDYKVLSTRDAKVNIVATTTKSDLFFKEEVTH